jgi:hypothetical protein
VSQLNSKVITNRIQKLSKEGDLSHNDLRLVIALERAVARIEAHPKLSEHLFFKGGFVLLKTLMSNRFTRDIDALALDLRRSLVPDLVKTALKSDLDDGLWFGDIEVEDLKGQGDYGGYRITFSFQIGDPPAENKLKKLSRLHLDIGFGDEIERPKIHEEMSSILPNDTPVLWKIYPLEFIYSEKIQALVDRGQTSSRAKDIYDMTLIFTKLSSLPKCWNAIKKTFETRKTPLPKTFSDFVASFNTSVLEASWQSVHLVSPEKSFIETWSLFKKQVETLDHSHLKTS